MRPEQEREFLLRLAAPWLGCRLAVMGGHPLVPQYRPVRCFRSLSWHALGDVDYSREMRLMCMEVNNDIAR